MTYCDNFDKWHYYLVLCCPPVWCLLHVTATFPLPVRTFCIHFVQICSLRNIILETNQTKMQSESCKFKICLYLKPIEQQYQTKTSTKVTICWLVAMKPYYNWLVCLCNFRWLMMRAYVIELCLWNDSSIWKQRTQHWYWRMKTKGSNMNAV